MAWNPSQYLAFAGPRMQPAIDLLNRIPQDAPGTVIEYTVPDMYGRPWAETWQRYHEQGMTPPSDDDIFDFD